MHVACCEVVMVCLDLMSASRRRTKEEEESIRWDDTYYGED